MQKQKGIHKWQYRSKIGIYLGRSANHPRNVGLVLNRSTGLVSPQFHVEYDKFFQTAKEDKFDATWQAMTGLIKEESDASGKAKVGLATPLIESTSRKREQVKSDAQHKASKLAKREPEQEGDNQGPAKKPRLDPASVPEKGKTSTDDSTLANQKNPSPMIADRANDSRKREGGAPPGSRELPALGSDPLKKADSVGTDSPSKTKRRSPIHSSTPNRSETLQEQWRSSYPRPLLERLRENYSAIKQCSQRIRRSRSLIH